MPTITITELRHRYDAYRYAVMILKASHRSVAERKSAIDVRDEFERDIGILDGLFAESENWAL